MFAFRCGCKPPNDSLALPLGNFIKRFPIVVRRSVRATSITNAASAAGSGRSSRFETLNSRQKEQIHLYVDTLLQWNQKMNLTAVRDVDEVMERHIEDSLAILPPIKSSYISHCNASCDGINVVDVGSGAGLPGFVLAIACPGWRITLLESMNKRCAFLEHVVGVTGLLNVQVIRGRAEKLGQDLSHREKFDVAVARAVAEMRVLAEYCLPLVRVGGLFVAAKGHDPQEEARNAANAVQLMGGSPLQLCPVESHSPYGQRTAVVCLKQHPTPRKYPRDPGQVIEKSDQGSSKGQIFKVDPYDIICHNVYLYRQQERTSLDIASATGFHHSPECRRVIPVHCYLCFAEKLFLEFESATSAASIPNALGYRQRVEETYSVYKTDTQVDDKKCFLMAK